MSADTSAKNPLAERFGKQDVLVFDGAMGTELYSRGFFINTCYESLCLTAPEAIKAIHRSYAEAGAEVLLANSFGANARTLARFGFGEKVREINGAAVRLARESANPGSLVAGSVGPFTPTAQDAGLPEAEIVALLAEQARLLTGAGADFILWETLSTVADVERAISAANVEGTGPWVVSLKTDREGRSSAGEPLEKLLAPLSRARIAPVAVGLNCGEGPESTLGALEKLVKLTSLPVIARPNAGIPRVVDGRTLYMCSPEYLTTYALRYLKLGARGIGGCCGTGPEHIRDMARSLRPLAASSAKIPAVEISGLAEPVPMKEKSAFAAKLAAGEWVTTVELLPPRGWVLDDVVEKARQCRLAGVTAVNIPDGPRASARMSPMITSMAIQDRAGIEAIVHFCCRDRSLLGMQADLLGCAAGGLKNILFITGDPPKLGDYPFSSAVFDADSIGMVAVQNRLNRGVDMGGKKLDSPARALIGVGADPSAIPLSREIERLRRKADAGAEFVITQPVFDPSALLRFLDAVAGLKLPFIAGIWPLASLRNAEFMNREVPGVSVPGAAMERMAGAGSKEAQRVEGIRIAREIVSAVRGRVQGIQVSTPLGHLDTALAVLKEGAA
jgi:homocysteine S-methyltransferase